VNGLILSLALLAQTAAPDTDITRVRRFAVVAGANRGAADRVPLRYGVTDAERFAAVVTTMGGVRPEDCTVLRDPSRRSFLDALAGLQERARVARPAATRVDVLVYFSGHADDNALMLGREIVTYRELRDAVADVAADVGITILDACASGAITRLKGGRTHPAFLTDASTQVQGYAFLTSSSENEAAQESERLQGSFFTHALLTGLRGAADVSGDGQVTLGEAYQFGFNETLAQTAGTQAGAQHPAYDIKMAGRGDVVMTDLRQTTSSLVFGPEYDGRLFVLTPSRRLVAELAKTPGRSVELGLEPGTYEVYFEQSSKLLLSSVELQHGDRRELLRADMRETHRLPTRRRGGWAARDLVDGRSRIQFELGVSDLDVRTTNGFGVDPDSSHWGASGGLVFVRGLRRDLAGEFSLALARFHIQETGTTTDAEGRLAAMVGLRYYLPVTGGLRPYAVAAAGPLLDWDVNEVASGTSSFTSSGGTRGTKLGATIGGGTDLFLGRHFTLTLDGRYLVLGHRSPFPSFGEGRQLSINVPGRFAARLGFGLTFGGGRP
jgi:opacity protein-like surface antigen